MMYVHAHAHWHPQSRTRSSNSTSSCSARDPINPPLAIRALPDYCLWPLVATIASPTPIDRGRMSQLAPRRGLQEKSYSEEQTR